MVQIKLDASETKLESYRGKRNLDGQKNGKGNLSVSEDNLTLQKYIGSFTEDNLHGEGVYTQTKPGNNFIYEGTIYANEFEGCGKVIHGNCTYYEGLFKGNLRFGPGVVSHADGAQDVGFWNGTDLMRLGIEVNQGYVPKLALTANGKIEILKYRKIVCIKPNPDGIETSESLHFNSIKSSNLRRHRNSYFFNHPKYNTEFFDNQERNIKVIKPGDDLSKLKKILSNVKVLESYTPKELCLLQQKFTILSALLSSTRPSNEIQDGISEVEITDLLAWNNEEYMLEVLGECFKHRNRESFINCAPSKIIQGKRKAFNVEGNYEMACKLFLDACSNDNDMVVMDLQTNYGINPDLTDSQGNSGVIFAASRDQICTLKILVNLGAKLDIFNDENISALNLCFLRYISIHQNIQDWEKGFLINSEMKNALDGCSDWRGRHLDDFEVMVAHSYIDYAASVGSLQAQHLQEKKDLILQSLNDNMDEPTCLSWFFGTSRYHLNLESQDFQSKYSLKENSTQEYLFNWRYQRVETLKKTKPKKGTLKQVNVKKLSMEVGQKVEAEKKCQVICNTIEALLRLGANPNLCKMPMPTVLLCLYCDNPMFLEMLVDVQADLFEVYTEDQLNLLHIVCSMPPAEGLHKLAATLLRSNLDARQQCGSGHWKEEIEKIRGDPNFDPSKKIPKTSKKGKTAKLSREVQKDDIDVESEKEEAKEEGKTPLHILVLRRDFEEDPENHLGRLGKVIARKVPETLTDLYLGHTPLSLAVLKGNLNLVQTFLEVHADPNIKLAEDLGNVFTIYCLKRYGTPKALPDVNLCKEILHSLVMFGGNPCLPIGGYGNALEFIEADNAPSKIDEDDETETLNIRKGKKIKDIPKKTSKLKKDKKEKETPQKEIKNYIRDISKTIILTHLQGKLCILLMLKILEGTIKDFTHLFEFLTSEDAVRVIVLFTQDGILDLRKDSHYFLAYLFLECVDKYGLKDQAKVDKKGKTENGKTEKGKNKKGSEKKLTKSKKGSARISKPTEKGSKKTSKEVTVETTEQFSKSEDTVQDKPTTNQDILKTIITNTATRILPNTCFELDKNISSYKSCFYCGLKTDKTLIPCPNCGLIYYCSQECNAADTKTKSHHPCKLTFYNEELENLQKSSDKKRPTVNNLAVTFRKLQLSLPPERAHNPMFMQLIKSLKNSERTEKGQKDTSSSEDVSKYLTLMGLHLDNLKFDTDKYDHSQAPKEQTPVQKHSLRQRISTISVLLPIPFSISYVARKSAASLTRSITNSSSIPSENSNHSRIVIIESSKIVPVRTSASDESVNLDQSGQHSGQLMNTSLRISDQTNDTLFVQKQVIRKPDGTGKAIKDEVKKEVEFKIAQRVTSEAHKKPGLQQHVKLALKPKVPSTNESKIVAFKKGLGNQQFINTLNKLFPDFDFTTAMAPFVCYSDSQFYYKFGDKEPEYFSTHM